MHMSEIDMILIFTTGADSCIPIGSMISRLKKIQPLWLKKELRHFVIALDGLLVTNPSIAPLLVSEHEATLGAIMLFASDRILNLVFQDIAPQSRLKKHWAPPLGAVIGFSITVFSQMLLN